jgi:hypothetical protein
MNHLHRIMFGIEQEDSHPFSPWKKSLYRPDEITESEANRLGGLVQCQKCKWWNQYQTFRHGIGMKEWSNEWCRACGRVATKQYFNSRQAIPYIPKEGDISLGTRTIPFHLKSRDPRKIAPYDKYWQKHEGQVGWIYSEKDMKYDFFNQRIGPHPKLQSLLYCMPILEESKIPEKAKVVYEDFAISNTASGCETEALIIENKNDRIIIEELNQCSKRDCLYVPCIESSLSAEYDEQTQTGVSAIANCNFLLLLFCYISHPFITIFAQKILISITLNIQAFRASLKVKCLASLLGAWYSMLPFKLSELTIGLPAGRNKTTAEKSSFVKNETGIRPRPIPAQRMELENELDEDKYQALIDYKNEASGIKSSLSFISSSGKARNGGIVDDDVSFKGTLRRFFRENLTDNYTALCEYGFNSLGLSPVGKKLGIISTHRPMSGQSSLLSMNNTHGLKSYLSEEDLDICHRYLSEQLIARKREATGINGIMTQLENLHHQPVDHVEGFIDTLQLLDFQREAVQWASERERVEGGIQSFLWTKLPSAYRYVTDKKMVPVDVYYSPILDTFTMDKPLDIRGGIIAEQMVCKDMTSC